LTASRGKLVSENSGQWIAFSPRGAQPLLPEGPDNPDGLRTESLATLGAVGANRLLPFISYLNRAITFAGSEKYPPEGDPTNELPRSIGS
jgi:hypothetical protein